MKNLPITITAELLKDVVTIWHLFTITTDVYIYHWTDANNSIYYNGNWWVSKKIAIDQAGVTLTNQTDAITLSIANVDKAFSNMALTENLKGKECIIERVLLDRNLTIIATPIVLFAGYLDAIVMDRAKATIQVFNHMIKWKTPTPKRPHSPTCPYVFQDPATCRYDGILEVTEVSDLSVQFTRSRGSLNFQNINDHLGCLAAAQTYLADSDDGAGHVVGNLFDEVFTNYWMSAATGLPHWVRVQFATAKIITGYMITVATTQAYMPRDWKFQGSNDGSTWIDIDVRSGVSAWLTGEKRIFDISNTTTYVYYRLYITLNQSGNQTAFYQLCLFGPSNQINDEDYNYTSAATAMADMFSPVVMGLATDVTSIVVTVRVRAKQTSAGARNLAARIRIGTTDYDASAISPATSFTDYDFVFATNPFTGAPWTPVEVSSLVDLCTGGTPSADATLGAGYEAIKGFDNNGTTYWDSGATALPHWLQYQLSVAEIAKGYTILGHPTISYDPTAWTFRGSNNGVDWTTLDTRSGISWSASEKKFFGFTNTTAYSYYRLNITAGGVSGEVVIDEMEILLGIPIMGIGYSTPADAGVHRIDVSGCYLKLSNAIASLICDLSHERCVALNNRINFGGFYYISELAVKEYWWGAKQRVWTGPY